jgi:hypothetical protein
MHDHARRTTLERVTNKAMAIESFAFESDKNRPRFNLAGIGDHLAKAHFVSFAY